MYNDLKGVFWWPNMKREIAQYILECTTCQHKVDHKKNSRSTTTIRNSNMEMGGNKYGFCYMTSQNIYRI
jgi:hypothetical protein